MHLLVSHFFRQLILKNEAELTDLRSPFLLLLLLKGEGLIASLTTIL